MSDTDRYCQDCETSFDTLTELRLHDCDDFRADESTEELESEFGESETYEFHGEVDTWSGTVEATSTGPIIDQASGRDCALCGDDAAVLMDPTIEWKRILREEHDGYNPVSSHQQIPLCPPCDVRLDALREGEKERGYYDDDVGADIDAERLDILRSINPDAIFANPPEDF